MGKFNLLITKLFDLILYPFGFVNPFWGVFFLSFISSIIVLIIYSKVSNPDKIKDAKDKIKGYILAIRIYRDHWKVLLISFFKSLLYTIKYFALNFGPILFILPILFFVFAQMEMRYGYRPFHQGETTIVKIKFNNSVDINNLNIKIKNNSPVKIEFPVYIDALNEIDYKMKVVADKTDFFKITINGKEYKKRVSINKKNHSKALGIRKYFVSTPATFLYPSEYEKIDNSDIKSISVKYPSYRINFLGTHWHWLIHYLLWTLIIVLAFKKKFGVEF